MDTTDSSGTATVPVTATFAGDQFYEPSQTSSTVGLQHMTGRGFGLSGNVTTLAPAPQPHARPSPT